MSAVGEAIDSGHPGVLRLTVLRSPFERALTTLIFKLPSLIQQFIRFFFPGFFLPDCVVLKKLKPNWDEEFDNEKLMYQRLASLQGDVIPKFYGETKFEGSRALVLSEVVGVLPIKQKLPPLEPKEFQRRVEAAFRELAAFDLAYDDVKLDNMIMVEDRIVLVDLESVWEPEPHKREYAFKSYVSHAMLVYDRYLNSLDDDDGF